MEADQKSNAVEAILSLDPISKLLITLPCARRPAEDVRVQIQPRPPKDPLLNPDAGLVAELALAVSADQERRVRVTPQKIIVIEPDLRVRRRLVLRLRLGRDEDQCHDRGSKQDLYQENRENLSPAAVALFPVPLFAFVLFFRALPNKSTT